MTILTGELHKLVFGGRLANTESWNCSIHMATQGVETELDSFAINLMVPPLIDWFGRAASVVNSTATLDYIKLNEVDRITGLYSDPSVSHTEFLEPTIAAEGSSGSQPPQLTTVLSWRTDTARGLASKGRIYPPGGYGPNTTGYVGTDGRLTEAAALVIANSAQELLSELNNATTNLTCVVWSQKGNLARSIEQVLCGRVIDTQQRRRRNLVESPVQATASV